MEFFASSHEISDLWPRERVRLTESEATGGRNLERMLNGLIIILANQTIRNGLHGGLKSRKRSWLLTRMGNIVERFQISRSGNASGHQKAACGIVAEAPMKRTAAATQKMWI